MLYDYIITQFYPSIIGLAGFSAIAIIVCVAAYSIGITDSNDKDGFKSKWKTKFTIFVSVHCFLLAFYFWLPDVNYVKHFYGEVRVHELTAQQKAELQAQYDKHYARSEDLFIKCLINGQKQPHTTTFNDTNEVVKTCYKVAQYKF